MQDLPWQVWAGLTALVAMFGLSAFRPTRQWVLDIVRAGRGATDPGACAAVPDSHWWRVLDEMVSKLATPLVLVDRGGTVRALNSSAEALTGYGFFAVENRPFSLLLDGDEKHFAAELSSYLDDFATDRALQWSGHRKHLVIKTSAGGHRHVTAYITHFGNGHGGFVLELLPVSP